MAAGIGMEGIRVVIWILLVFIAAVPKLVCSQESPGGLTPRSLGVGHGHP